MPIDPEYDYEPSNYVDMVKGLYSSREPFDPDPYDVDMAQNDYDQMMLGDGI